MRKLTIFVAAFVLTLGLAQCKKEQPAEPQNEDNIVMITLNVGSSTGSGTNGSRVNVDPNATSGDQVTFANGDKILVASDGKYVGYLQHNGTSFTGTITNPVQGQKLYFYFLGNKADVSQLTEGTSTTCTVNISDQTTTAGLPVISMGESDVSYPSSDNSYTSRLYNKCSLMKFNVDTPSTEPICITGMNNKVTVNFGNPTDSGFTYAKEGDGVIMMPGKNSNNETWAIVLPQGALSAGAEGTAYTYDGYKGNRPALDEIAANQYITTVADDLDVNTFDINYMPLTFEAKTANSSVRFIAASLTPAITMQYNTYDGTGWKPYTSGTAINLSAVGNKVSFRGDNNTLASNPYYRSNFSGSGQCYIYGNIMSLLSSTNYATATTLTGDYTFYALFQNNAIIYSHSSKALVLPATTLSINCYASMFEGCTKLTSAPERLPAMTLTYGCYANMFRDCGQLASAPELPATTLDYSCYYYMFNGCSSLKTAPALPATTLAPYCYSNMFYGCSQLTTAPALPAETLAERCYEEMFHGCGFTSAPTLPATTMAPYCYSCMFYSCSSLKSTPALPATTLAEGCYSKMFVGCGLLESVTTLPATTLAPYCYEQMFHTCYFIFDFPELPAQTLVEGCYKGMFYGSDIEYIRCLATDISAPNCTAGWVEDILNNDNTCMFVTPSSTAWTTGIDGIPSRWTRVNSD